MTKRNTIKFNAHAQLILIARIKNTQQKSRIY